MAEQTNDPQDILDSQDFVAEEEPAIENAEDAVEGEESEQQAPSPSFLSAEQMQEMLAQQQQQFAQSQRDLISSMQQQQIAQQQAAQAEAAAIRPPDPQAMARALEDGEMGEYIKLQNQQSLYMQQQYETRLAQLEQQGAQRFQEVNAALVKTAVPNYTKYEKDVEALMDDLQLPPELRVNAKVVGILADAARGRNFDREFDEATQQRRRQANQNATGEPTNTRQSAAQAGNDDPIHSPAAMEALRATGRSLEHHAKKLGYKTVEEYEAAIRSYNERRDAMDIPKWRRQA